MWKKFNNEYYYIDFRKILLKVWFDEHQLKVLKGWYWISESGETNEEPFNDLEEAKNDAFNKMPKFDADAARKLVDKHNAGFRVIREESNGILNMAHSFASGGLSECHVPIISEQDISTLESLGFKISRDDYGYFVVSWQ